MKVFKIVLLGLGLVLAAAAALALYVLEPWRKPVAANVGWVQVQKGGNGYQMIRNGQPYRIKGATIVDMAMLRQVKASGANSIRLYNTIDAGPILDSAHKLGLTVTLGLKLKQARLEMDYSDAAAVAGQFEALKKEVLRYRNHPALLMWAVGNETTLFIPHYYRNFFQLRPALKAIDDVAAMIHQLDPNHPTTMMLANVSPQMIRMASLVCRNIDLMSFNIFARLKVRLPQIAQAGWKGAYLISEFGNRGYWGADRTSWYSRKELSSYEKAQYLRTQFAAIEANQAHCLGSYIFLWGAKQEYSSTWFGMFSPWQPYYATELSAVCTEAWKGAADSLPVPSISRVLLNGRNDSQDIYLEPRTLANVEVQTMKPQQGTLQLHWEIHEEVAEYLNASYKQFKPVVWDDSTLTVTQEARIQLRQGEPGEKLRFKVWVPTREGPYRLYLYVVNESRKLAMANICFYAKHQ